MWSPKFTLLGPFSSSAREGLYRDSKPITILKPQRDTPPVPNNIQTFCVENSFFRGYAGNKSHPNEEKSLLANFRIATGVQLTVRVGSTSQLCLDPLGDVLSLISGIDKRT
ncbi:Beta-glucuronidase [Penicillium digitatum]|uniref:Beta-glucuronidase n=1 Tax=Penicillium digitatum TaxID=36651 RepID=A0A7T6XT78_PENDI|nr:Beta-glucuronidase [Penicillium digitatum]